MAFTLQAVLKFKDESKRGIQSAEKGFDKLSDTVKTAGIAIAGVFAADKVLDMAKMGAQAERIERRFGAFAQAAGGAEAVLAAFQRGAGGAASQMDAMASSSQLLQMGLVSNTAEMERVVTMATRLGDQTQSVTDRVENFALLLANQSLPRLDSFGISSGKVRTRIKELQEATEGMTRETAFMTAVMEEGAGSLDILGPRVDDNAASFERMEAKLADLAVTIGQSVVPIVVILVDALSGIVEQIAPIIEGFGEMVDAVQGAAGESEKVAEEISAVGEGLEDGSELAQKYADTVNVINKETQGLNSALLATGSALLGTASRTDLLSSATEGLQREAVRVSEDYDDYLRIIDEYNSKLVDSNAKIEEQTVRHVRGSTAVKAVKDETALLTEAQHQYFQILLELEAGTGAAEHETRKLEQSYRDAHRAATEYKQQIQFTETELKLVTSATESFDQAMLNSVNAVKSGIVVTDEHEIALRQQYQAAQAAEAAQESLAAKAARVADMQAASAERAAAAMAAQQEAADNLARSQGDLMVKMSGATEEMFKQEIFQQIDPAAMGIEAYAGLGVELGLIDEKAAGLMESIGPMVEALEKGIVPTENAAEAIQELFNAASDAEPPIGAILDKYAAAPGLIGPSKDAQDDLNETLIKTGEVGAETEGSIAAFGDAVEITRTPVRELSSDAETLYGDLTDLAKDWEINIITTYRSSGTPTAPPIGGPAFQMGGVVPGRIGEPRLIQAHGGEVVLNPFQTGALGGPGGPPVTNNSFGGDTFVNNIYDPLAAKVVASEQYRMRRRRSR
jgi:hypothetical protein